jgi:hypothetical protein
MYYKSLAGFGLLWILVPNILLTVSCGRTSGSTMLSAQSGTTASEQQSETKVRKTVQINPGALVLGIDSH